jgi:ABC-type antimicrobial peptide transport system permease subunit
MPYLQAPASTGYVVIRGTLPVQQLAALVRRAVAEIDSDQAVGNVATMGELIDRNAARHRFNMILLLWFGICAAILAASGVYSMMAETMAEREREIAIRTTLGAQRLRLVQNMASPTLCSVLIGEILGATMLVAFGTVGAGLFYGVSARDPAILGFVAGFLFFISLGAAFGPAWAAATGDAMASLRSS